MSRDGDTPARSPSSMRISQWGIAQAWLSRREGRRFELTVDARGTLCVSAIDVDGSTYMTAVEPNEDPSKAAIRASAGLGGV